MDQAVSGISVIIAGSRSIADRNRVMDAIDGCYYFRGDVERVISGCAPGVDTAALMKPWACEVVKMPAQWQKFGRRSGILRNQEMATIADGLLAIWDKRSAGTGHMISTMQAQKKLVAIA